MLYLQVLIISLGITLGLFLAYQGYKYFLSGRKQQVYVPRLVLHSVEGYMCKGNAVFHFEIKATQPVVFEICNSNFEPLMELENTTLEDGSYTITFDTTRVPNGEYFYRIRGESQQVMKKFEVRN